MGFNFRVAIIAFMSVGLLISSFMAMEMLFSSRYKEASVFCAVILCQVFVLGGMLG